MIITKQLLRSGTSIGANINEAYFAQSTPDYIHKFHIALKEASESSYWLQLIHQTNIRQVGDLIELIEEIKRMLISSINTLKKKRDMGSQELRTKN